MFSSLSTQPSPLLPWRLQERLLRGDHILPGPNLWIRGGEGRALRQSDLQVEGTELPADRSAWGLLQGQYAWTVGDRCTPHVIS